MVDVFEEVEEELRADRLKTLAKRFLPWALLGVVLGLLVAGLLAAASGAMLLVGHVVGQRCGRCAGPTTVDETEGLVEAGLQGIEVYYSYHTPEQTAFYECLAARYGLARSGGSDFHGASKPGIQLGTGLGELVVPAGLLAELRARRDLVRSCP